MWFMCFGHQGYQILILIFGWSRTYVRIVTIGHTLSTIFNIIKVMAYPKLSNMELYNLKIILFKIQGLKFANIRIPIILKAFFFLYIYKRRGVADLKARSFWMYNFCTRDNNIGIYFVNRIYQSEYVNTFFK